MLPETRRRNDLALDSQWHTLRTEAGVDGRHGVRQALHARLLAVQVITPYRGRVPQIVLLVERLDGPLAGTVSEWKASAFVKLWKPYREVATHDL